MARRAFLGVDCGTQSTKVLVVDATSEEVLGLGRAAHDLVERADGTREQDPNWWIGALLGLAHALMVLTLGMSLMPGIHPRMASEQHGPNSNRQLEPPGFMALNYGLRTPISVFLAHAAFGAILGALYQLAGAALVR